MISQIWELEIGDTRKTLADWKVDNVRLHRVNLGVDMLTFRRQGSQFDADPLCAYDAQVRLWRAEDKWFEGRRILMPGEQRPQSEIQNYSFGGPWQWLQRNVFKQLWTGYIGGVLTQRYTSHLLDFVSVQETVRSVLLYAIANGAPLQIGVLTAPVVPPFQERTDKTCAGTILDALEYAPDCVGYFDYSTSPPTFNLRPRSALPPITVATPPIQVISIQSREDVQVPSVDVTYEIVSEIDGQQRFGLVEDIYPPGSTGREDGCLSVTVNLQGVSQTHVNGTIVCEEIQTASVDWWKHVIPELASPFIRNLQIVGTPTRIDRDGTPSLGYHRMLVNGTIAPWMRVDGNPVNWQNEVFGLQVRYEVWSQPTGGIKLQDLQLYDFRQELVSTDAPAGETEFEALESTESGDPIPVGLAQYLYNSLSTLHYDCVVTLLEQECLGELTLGNTLNLAGGRPEWATMNALIQAVTFSIDSGETEIVAGPPRHLSLTDLLALLRANRVRRRWTNPETQMSGDVTASGDVSLGRATPNTNTVPGEVLKKLFSVWDQAAPATKVSIDSPNQQIYFGTADAGGNFAMTLDARNPHGSVRIRLTDCNGKDLFIQEIGVCVAGQAQHMMILASAPY
jgi:hypothetical protein